MKKLIIIAIVIVVVGGGGTLGYMKFAGGNGEDTGPATVEVSRDTLVEKALATGEIVPLHEIAVKSKISGTVARLFVEEGSYVHRGDPLIEVGPDPTPLEYAQAKRSLELQVLAEQQRQADLDRTSGLLERGMASQADHDKAVEAHDRASLQRQMASEELALLEDGRAEVAGRAVESIIFSPIAGHILKLNVDVGDPVVPLTSFQPGTELLALADMAELLFEGTVDEIDVGKIREDMPVEIKVGAFPDTVVSGRLTRISLKSEKKDNATVFGVEIEIETVPEGVVLRAGYSANSDIIIKRVDDVLVLPERVLVFRGDTTLVRLPAPEGSEPEELAIEIGMSDGVSVEVASGLEFGDEVLDKEIKEIK